MKKLILVTMSLLLIFALTSCEIAFSVIENLGNVVNQLTADENSTTTTVAPGDILEEPEVTEPEVTGPEVTEPEVTEPEVTEPEVTEPEVTEPEVTEPEVTEPEITEPEVTEPPVIGNLDNGVLKDASTEVMDVPANMELLEDKLASEETNLEKVQATVVLYTLDGDVVNWTTENDFIYVITKGNNRLVVINSKNMEPIYNVPLSGTPAEMNIIGEKIYISMPDLCKIDVFVKSTGAKDSSLYFDHEVSSFCLEENYIYYSEHDQWCQVFKKNLSTGEVKAIASGDLYYYPKLCLNKDERILYVGESNGSGCGLYYFDADTLTLKSSFVKNNYGIANNARELFHVGNEIFWGGYRLSDTNARELIGKYGTYSYGSITYASKELVSTYEGLYLADTYECVINYFDANFHFEYLLITDSYSIFFRQRVLDKNIIIGVNFNLKYE